MIDESAFVHPHGLVDEGATVGARTRVWAFAHVVKGAVVGAECNLCDHTLIEGGVRIGDRVTIKSGVYLWDGLVLDEDVFVGPAAVFTNDLRPRSRRYPDEFQRTFLRRGASIGAGAVVLAGIEIGPWAMVGAGAVVTRSVRPHELVFGNPARHRGWVCRCGEKLSFNATEGACACGRRFRLTSEGGAAMEVEP